MSELISREAALDAIQGLRHAAACTFTPEYSGSLGEARCNSFYEAYQAVKGLPVAPGIEAGTAEPRQGLGTKSESPIAVGEAPVYSLMHEALKAMDEALTKEHAAPDGEDDDIRLAPWLNEAWIKVRYALSQAKAE